jgi:putative FmdB family regulatory protein
MSPIYQYRCDRCGATFDQKRSFSDSEIAPMCGDCLISMSRVYSAPSVTFKGDGWGGK